MGAKECITLCRIVISISLIWVQNFMSFSTCMNGKMIVVTVRVLKIGDSSSKRK